MLSKLIHGATGCLVALFIFVLMFPEHVNAQVDCEVNRVVGVRGSGQLLDKSDELIKLEVAIRSALPLGPIFDELDNDLDFLLAQEPYKAASVRSWGSGDIRGIEAFVSSSDWGSYRRSVNTGKNLLHKYIDHYKGTGTCLFLVGYSQGAQVIGEVMTEIADEPAKLARIKYIGLMGDPKLDLDGIDPIPAKNVPWYRGDAKSIIHEGILSARKPYIPNDGFQLKVKSGSWCFWDDIVCSSNYLQAASGGHGKYVERGAIKAMAREITDIIKSDQPGAYASKYPASEGCGAQKQDLVVLLDTSPIMRRNANLFTDIPNPLDVRKAADGVTPLPLRTTGQMLLESGCGDKRVAVVGYGRPQDGAPQLLQDFTANPTVIDALLKSLYEETNSGTYERTQFREAAILGMSTSWRPDASHSLLALTHFAGTGPSSKWGWGDTPTMRAYLSDETGSQMIRLSRDHDVMISGLVVPLTAWSGYNQATSETALGDTKVFLKGIARETGAYNWTKFSDNYAPQTFRKIKVVETVRESERLREASYATAKPVRGKVGQSITLRVDDPTNLISSASLRSGHTIQYNWRPSCTKLVDDPYVATSTYTFTPTAAGKCKAAVSVSIRGSGAGCYSICPEPFPPYFNRLVTFDIEVLPANHHDPLPPGSIQNLIKRIYQDRIEYSWEPPEDKGQYSNQQLVYVIRDADGSVLGITEDTQVTITDTSDTDPPVAIVAAGEGGAGDAVDSEVATVIDMSPPPQEPVELTPIVDDDTPNVLGDNVLQEKPWMQPTYSAPWHIVSRIQPPVEVVNAAQQAAVFVAGMFEQIATEPSVLSATTGDYLAVTGPTIGGPDHTTDTKQGWFMVISAGVALAGCILIAIEIRRFRQHM